MLLRYADADMVVGKYSAPRGVHRKWQLFYPKITHNSRNNKATGTIIPIIISIFVWKT